MGLPQAEHNRALCVSAGVGILWKQHLHIEAVDPSITDAVFDDPTIASRMVCALLRVKGRSLLMAEACLFVWEGLSDRNRGIL